MVALLRLPTAFPGCIFYIETSHGSDADECNNHPSHPDCLSICRATTCLLFLQLGQGCVVKQVESQEVV